MMHGAMEKILVEHLWKTRVKKAYKWKRMAYWPLIPDSLQRTVTCPGPTGLLLPVNKQLVDVLGSIVAQADVPSEEIKWHWTKF